MLLFASSIPYQDTLEVHTFFFIIDPISRGEMRRDPLRNEEIRTPVEISAQIGSSSDEK